MIAKNLRPWGTPCRSYCKRCSAHRSVKSLGDLYLMIDQREKAVDGKEAMRIIWICRDGHIHEAGWSRPVDFSMGHEKNKQNTDISYDERLFSE